MVQKINDLILILTFLIVPSFRVECKKPTISKPIEIIGLDENAIYIDSSFHWKEGLNDAKEFFKYVRSYAKKGYPSDINMLGYLYYFGIGTCVNRYKSIDYFEKAANLGSVTAMINAGNFHVMNLNYSRAENFYEKAANKNSFAAQILHGLCLMRYSDTNQRHLLGDSLLKSSVLKFEKEYVGDAYSAYCLGICYARGYGVDQDKLKAYEYLKESSKSYKPALCTLASFYRWGIGIKADRELEVKCLQEAADFNVAEAAETLAGYYVRGEVVEKNWDKAYELYLKAYISDNRKSFGLASCYKYGWGVKKDEDKYRKLMKSNNCRSAERRNKKELKKIMKEYKKGNVTLSGDCF